MSEVTHKAVVTSTEELVLAHDWEPVTLKTWGPACGRLWAPGMQMDRRDERITCEACLAKGKSDV
jgi:hypothetical protein